MLNKYLEHGALHRLERKFARLGADISRQCQSDAVERFSSWMRPIYELIDKKAKACSYLQIDETFIKYINGRSPGGGQGYFWAIHAPGQSMVLKWIDNRRHENVETLIDGFEGILQSDAYAAYGNYVKTHPQITLMACWSQAFRKFRDALEVEPAHAKFMMNWMFIGHPDAGEKSAIVYALLNCCRIHRVDPQAYFLDVLDKMIPHDHRPPEELLEALLPENWIKANPGKVLKDPN